MLAVSSVADLLVLALGGSVICVTGVVGLGWLVGVAVVFTRVTWVEIAAEWTVMAAADVATLAGSVSFCFRLCEKVGKIIPLIAAIKPAIVLINGSVKPLCDLCICSRRFFC